MSRLWCWVVFPTVCVRRSDGSHWKPHHPGYPSLAPAFYFVRLRKAWIGWWVDYHDAWSFDDPQLFDVL